MKKYEAASLVDLGPAVVLVLGPYSDEQDNVGGGRKFLAETPDEE